MTIAFFDDLVHRTQDVMSGMCRTLGLDFHPCLLTPTFNGMPILSNSHYNPVAGLDPAATERHTTVLSSGQMAAVEAIAMPLYDDLVSRYGLGRH